MKKKVIPGLAAFLMANAMLNPLFKQQTITTPNSPQRNDYNLPKWKVGKHYIYAKNAKDALKYAKKRGLWDRTSYPITIV